MTTVRRVRIWGVRVRLSLYGGVSGSEEARPDSDWTSRLGITLEVRVLSWAGLCLLHCAEIQTLVGCTQASILGPDEILPASAVRFLWGEASWGQVYVLPLLPSLIPSSHSSDTLLERGVNFQRATQKRGFSPSLSSAVFLYFSSLYPLFSLLVFWGPIIV